MSGREPTPEAGQDPTRARTLPLVATPIRPALHTLLLAREAFAQNHRDASACLRTAEFLLALQRPTEVLDTLDRLDASLGRGAAWHLLRSSALTALRDDRQAVREATAAVANSSNGSSPDAALHRRALLQLGQGLMRLREHADAGWCFRTVLDAHPQAVDAALHAAFGSAAALDWERLPADIDRLLASANHPAATALWTPDTAPPDPGGLLPLLDHPLLLRWLATLACQQHPGAVAAKARPKAPARRSPRQGRWRLGVLTGGRGRPAARPPAPALDLFEWLDREQVELYVYSDAWSDHPGATAPVNQPLRSRATRWHDCRHTDTEDLAGVIRADRIDLLIDLTGCAEGSRLDVLAQRPAAIQVAWTGHAGTTGAPWVDYLIGDPITTPLAAQPQFSECLAQLPQRHWTAADPAPDATRPEARRADCGLPGNALVLACFTRPERLAPAQFRHWCQLLAAVPDAVLWLLAPTPEAQQRLRQYVAGAGIDPARLVFAPFVPQADHLARLALADLVLDTSPGNAETAAREALQAGVPVLTQPGQSAAARRTASLLHAYGLPELVCADPEQSLRTAVRILQNTADRAALRTRLAAARTQSPLPDRQRAARDLQHLLSRMLARQDAGLPPIPLAAAPGTRRD